MANAKKGAAPTRSIRISDRLWGRFDQAAKLAGVSRNHFIVAVCKHAAHQIIESARRNPKWLPTDDPTTQELMEKYYGKRPE